MDLLAHYVHGHSPRARGPFIAVNCAGLTETLLESELFGHFKGSFTGAYRDKLGQLQLAHGGTLFMDEVGEMSLRMQALLLRFLENGEIQPVGAERARNGMDVRVVAATNRRPADAMRENRLREDLYYRLAAFPIELPPLRERGEDVVELAEFFLARLNDAAGTAKRFSAGSLDAARRHAWPGNVRELKLSIEKSVG